MSKKIKDIAFWLVFSIIIVGCIMINRSSRLREEQMTVSIHIKGEVNAPGYYELPYGSRVKDAIKYAGGETDNADIHKLNLALKLRDGEEIQVPDTGDEEKAEKAELININTADIYQLCKLDGIGEKLAGRIVEYRMKNGSFKSIEALKRVKGIGETNFQEIKDKITV